MCAILFLPHLAKGINLGDEGYLWHGVRQLMRGQVPIRDFRAYDPGRYWWCAPWAATAGASLRTVRASMLGAQVLGLATASATLALAGDDWLVAICGTVALAAWMFPSYRQIDLLACLTVVALAIVVMTTEQQGLMMLAGVVLMGLVLPIGINHALYGTVALGAVLALRALSGDLPATGTMVRSFALGLEIGIAPFVLVLAATPGLARAYWRHKVAPIAARGTTNLTTTIPWLWSSLPNHLRSVPRGFAVTVRLGFTLVPVINAAILVAAAMADGDDHRLRSAGAAAIVGLTYTHHALSRADAPHLATAMLPTLAAVALVAAGTPPGWLAVATLAAAFIVLVYSPYEGAHGLVGMRRGLVDVEFSGTRLRLTPELAQHLLAIQHVVVEWSDPGTPVVFVPGLATLYPLMDRYTAVYDVFSVYPASPADEIAMLDEIARHRPPLVLVDDSPLDGRDELRFSRTHPAVWQHLNRSFAIPATVALPANHHLFVADADRDRRA